MGLISQFFSSFRQAGASRARTTQNIQSISQTGTVQQPRITTSPQTQISRRISTTSAQIQRSSEIQFATKEVSKINRYIVSNTQKIPTLAGIQRAGYNYARANPQAAKMIYGSGDFGARIVKKAVQMNPLVSEKKAITASQAMYAFSDGAISGVRNEPVKTLAMFALPGAVGGGLKVASKIPAISKIVANPRAMKLASGLIGVAYSKNIYNRVNAPVYDYTNTKDIVTKTESKKMPDGSILITETVLQRPTKRTPTVNEKSDRLGYIWGTEVGPMAVGELGLRVISKPKFNKLNVKGASKKVKQIYIKEKGKAKKFIRTEKTGIQKEDTKAVISKANVTIKKRIDTNRKNIKSKINKINTKVVKIKKIKTQITKKLSPRQRKQWKQILKEMDHLLTRQRDFEKWKVEEAKIHEPSVKTKELELKNLERETLALKKKIDKAWLEQEKGIKSLEEQITKDEVLKTIYNVFKTPSTRPVILKGKKPLTFVEKQEIALATRQKIRTARKSFNNLTKPEKQIVYETTKTHPHPRRLKGKKGKKLTIAEKQELALLERQRVRKVKKALLSLSPAERKIVFESYEPPKKPPVKKGESQKRLEQKRKESWQLKKGETMLQDGTVLRSKVETEKKIIQEIKHKAEAKAKVVSESKTRTEFKTKEKLVLKEQIRLKNTKMGLLILLNKSKEYKNNLKNHKMILLSLIKEEQETKPTTKITKINTHIKKIDSEITKIDQIIINIPKIIEKTKLIEIPKPKIKIRQKPKNIETPILIIPPLRKPVKTDTKKKRKLKGKKARTFIVKNKIPSFKDIYG